MGNLNEVSKETLTPRDISIKRVKPKDLTDNDYQNLGLAELVAKGYGYSGTPKYLLEQAQVEYDGVDKEDRFDIFLALANGKAVGSVSAIDWSASEPKRGKKFWEAIQKTDPALFERAKSVPHAFDVAGIVTHPDYRNRKIAKRLLWEAVIQLKPSFIVGQTKTPEAVMTRTNALNDAGFVTFYGDSAISQLLIDTDVGKTVLNAYLFARNKTLDEHGLLYVDTTLLLPTVPDVSTFPAYVQDAFRSVIEGQQRIGDAKTAAKPLISVSKNLL